ncbi:MAG: DUF1566 domain-containing protein [Rikenellaceae bacterium]
MRIKQTLFAAPLLAAALLVGCQGDGSSSGYTQVATGQVNTYNLKGEVVNGLSTSDDLYGQDADFKRGAPMAYRYNGDGTVTDLNTGLTWQQTPPSQGMSWAEAQAYCDSLNLAGHGDWRLPTAKELYSISDFNTGWPYINTDYFHLSNGRVDKDEQYWTSHKYVGTTVEGRNNAAFGVNHVTGHIKAYAAGSNRGGGGEGGMQRGGGESQGEGNMREGNMREGGMREEGMQREGGMGMREGGMSRDSMMAQRGMREGMSRDSIMAQRGMREGMSRDSMMAQRGTREGMQGGQQQMGGQGQMSGQGQTTQGRGEMQSGRSEQSGRSDMMQRDQSSSSQGRPSMQGEQSSSGSGRPQREGQEATTTAQRSGGQSAGRGMMMAGGNSPMNKQVRAVRGAAYGQNDFVDNNDGTISDKATGLMWAKGDGGKAMEWGKALIYAKESTLAGYDDWRLPNVKELQGIVDYNYAPTSTRLEAAINPMFYCTVFENEAGDKDYGYYWTGTSACFRKGDPFYFAWYVAFGRAVNNAGADFHGAGAVRFDSKSDDGTVVEGGEERYYNFVRLVRDIK